MFWVDIEDSAGNKLGPGPIISGIRWSYRQRLSRAGEWSLEVPATEPRLEYATLKRQLHCYAQLSPGVRAWMGGGPIEDMRVSLRENSPPAMVLSGGDPLRELAAKTVNFSIPAGTLNKTDDLLNSIFGVVPAWSYDLDGGIFLPDLTARFVHETALNALVLSCDKLDAWFRLIAGATFERTVLIGQTPVATSILATNLADPVAIERNLDACLIRNIEQSSSAWNVINSIFVYGAGDGEARLTLAAASEWPNGSGITNTYAVTDIAGRNHNFVLNKATNTITDSASVASYGTFEQAVAVKDIAPITNTDADVQAAANALVAAAVAWLIDASQPQEQYSLSVAGLRQTLLPGDQIRVEARQYRDGERPINIDEDLIVLETQTDLDADGPRVSGLTVATTRHYQATDGEIVADAIRQATASQAHPQTGPGWNTISYREDIDDTRGAEFPFWLGLSVTLLNSVILRFTVGPFRSTVQASVASSGTIANNEAIAPTSAPDNAFHGHPIPIFDNNGTPTGNPVYYHDAVGFNVDSAGAEEGADAVNATHSHTVTVPGHTHGLEIELSNSYGVFEDTAANTYGVADLAWEVNGAAVAETPEDIGGWYQLDLTAYLYNSTTFRPLRDDNVVAVEVANKTDKRVRVTAQIEIRPVIQSIAVI